MMPYTPWDCFVFGVMFALGTMTAGLPIALVLGILAGILEKRSGSRQA